MANERLEVRNFTGRTAVIKTAGGETVELPNGGTAHIFDPTITIRPAADVPAEQPAEQPAN